MHSGLAILNVLQTILKSMTSYTGKTMRALKCHGNELKEKFRCDILKSRQICRGLIPRHILQ